MTALDAPPAAARVRRGLGWSTGGNVLLRVGNFGTSIIMARLIAPEQFGVFAVALTVWGVLGTLAEFGLGTDLVRAPDLARRIPTVATLGILTSGALALGMVLAAPLIAAAFDSPASTSVLRLMAVSMALFGFTIVPAAVLQRKFRQGSLFAINGAALIASTATMTTLAVLEYGPLALALGQIASQLTVVVGQHLVTRMRPCFGFDRTVAAESARFCLPLAGANLLSWVLISVDNLVVARVLGPVDLGLYVLAFNVSSWPMSAVGQAVRVVALPAFARVAGKDRQALGLERVVGPLWAISLLLGTGLAVGADAVVRLLYGDRWAGAATALAGLAIFGSVRVVFDLIATFLIAVGETRAVLAVQVIWLVAMVPAMWLGVSWAGLQGAGWVHLGVALVATLPAYLVCLRRTGVRPARLAREALVPTLIILPTVAGWVAVSILVSKPLVELLLMALLAIVLFVLPMTRWWVAKVRLLQSATTEPSAV